MYCIPGAAKPAMDSLEIQRTAPGHRIIAQTLISTELVLLPLLIAPTIQRMDAIFT
ncbi:MAG: hypothetical protein AAFV31_17085 [Pseudomonadota bacterium]